MSGGQARRPAKLFPDTNNFFALMPLAGGSPSSESVSKGSAWNFNRPVGREIKQINYKILIKINNYLILIKKFV